MVFVCLGSRGRKMCDFENVVGEVGKTCAR